MCPQNSARKSQVQMKPVQRSKWMRCKKGPNNWITKVHSISKSPQLKTLPYCPIQDHHEAEGKCVQEIDWAKTKCKLRKCWIRKCPMALASVSTQRCSHGTWILTISRKGKHSNKPKNTEGLQEHLRLKIEILSKVWRHQNEHICTTWQLTKIINQSIKLKGSFCPI